MSNELGTHCAKTVTAIDVAQRSLQQAVDTVEQYLMAHNYCFNSSDDVACDVDGSDCRDARERMHHFRHMLTTAMDALSTASLAPRMVDAFTRTT